MLDSNQHRRFWRPPCYQLHQCHIPDLVNVQVGKTRHGGLDFTVNGKERGRLSAPFGRASPSVVNRLTRAGSLLASTSSMYAYSSNTIDLTGSYPMKPRANLGNRTRQPKGCANRIASQPQKQMAQPYRRHRVGPAQETMMDAISRTIQKHTLYSGIHPPSKGPQPDSNRHLTTHGQEKPENHARLTLPQER